MPNAERRRLTPIRTLLLLLLAVASLAGSIGISLAAPSPAAAAAQPARDPVHVSVTPTGFEPATVNVIVGQTVVFDNETGAERTIAADNAVFDSGAIPADGAFALTLSQPGAFDFTSPGDPQLYGLLVVGLAALPGGDAVKVSDVIPDLEPSNVSDLARHPEYGIAVSRTRLLVVPSATATVGAFNTLLATNDLTIVGGLVNMKELVVATADPGDHTSVLAAATALRASNQVQAAVLDFEVKDQSIPRPVPTPSPTDPLATWTWTDPGGPPTSADANWGLRDVRAPSAWNLLDAARISGQRSVLALAELNFGAAHPDLDIEAHDPCNVRGVPCKALSDGSHGQHTSGIVGARYDNTGPDATHTLGVAGVNPMAQMYGFVARTSTGDVFNGLEDPDRNDVDDVDGYSLVGSMWVLDHMLGMTDTGEKLAGLRAINISLGAGVFDAPEVAAWWKLHPYDKNDLAKSDLCGPLANDDNTAAAVEPCYPGNLDAFRVDFNDLADAMVPALQLAANKRVILVKSAGNDGDSFCIDRLTGRNGTGCLAGFDTMLDMRVDWMNEFAAARKLPAAPKPAPVIIVEAHDVTGKPASFTQRGGDVSAPGVAIVSSVASNTGPTYEAAEGTSMAAPHVTGALGYLFSVKPSNDWVTYRAAIINSARPSPAGGAPHLDLFAAEVRLNMLEGAVDVNDWSADGNRRVFYGAYGTPVALDTVANTTIDDLDDDLGPRTSSPDGKVDMRDFRRFRDAWLQSCQEGSAGTQSGAAPACPVQIALDGPAAHPKKDGNGDRCVTTPTSNCQAMEGSYSRFDANGDGRLSVYAAAPVAIDSLGRATTAATPYTDLEVLQVYFETSTANTEGWAKTTLPSLLVSSDVEVRLDEFWASGATSVHVVTIVDGTAVGPTRTFSKPAAGSGGGIVTVPVAPTGSKVELVASATAPDGTPLVGTPFMSQMVAGADASATPCVARLELAFDAPALLPGKETGITAQFRDCNIANNHPETKDRPVEFGVDAAGTEVPVLTTSATTTMDEKGKATAGLRAGTGTGTFTVWAEVELPGSKTLRGEADVTVSEEITMAYHWRSTLDTYEEQGTTRWAGQPDCSNTGVSYCIEHSDAHIEPNGPGVPSYMTERRGTITATEDGVLLSEEIDGIPGLIEANFSWTDLASGEADDAIKRYFFGTAAVDENRYTNHPVPVGITPVNDEVWVSNLRTLAELGYRGVLEAGGTNGGGYAKEIVVPWDFFLKPRTDGSSIAYANDRDRVLRFTPANPTNASGYQWCGSTGRDLTQPPGYYHGELDPWIIGAIGVDRDTHYDPGDEPLMTTTGTIRFDVSFAATVSIGGAPADPVLPTCDGPNPPTADFSVVNPAPIEEGEAVQFVDRSIDVDGDIASWAWDFGGAGSSTVQDATFGAGFPDEGTYPVRLTVTDGQGHSADFRRDVTVVNAKPTVEAMSPITLATAQVATSVAFRVDDPGEDDRQSLKVTLASSNTKFGTARTVNRPAGSVKFDLGGLPAGDYPLTVTVTDDAGATATATTTLIVSPVPPESVPAQPAPPVIVDAPGCTTPIPLDADEAELLARINAQRNAVHLPPLVVSAKLTAAADRHSSDLLANNILSDTGSDGSTSRQRFTDAGYPRTATIEEWSSNAPTVADAWSSVRRSADVESWFSSRMAMIGISHVADDTNTRWVVSVGGVIDCNEAPRSGGQAPVASLSAPTTVEEGITVTIDLTSTDPDGDLALQTVNWGDGAVGGRRHRYNDDGTYTITVTAADQQGHLSTATADIVVTATAPEVAITPARLVAGTPALISFTMVELAPADRPLAIQVTSDPAGYAPAAPVTTTLGGYLYKVTPLEPGSFTVTVRATDRDGQVGTATQTFHVDAPPGQPAVAPDNVVLPPAPTCASGMEVIGQAAEQLALLNEYRARHGLGPVVVVPELTQAAERHADDMAAHRFFAHEGSDGSTPGSRITATGYRGGGGENIALRTVTPGEQMAGWIMSPPHHNNILNPSWKAIGIADVNGPDGVLAVNVFGDRITCPTGSEDPPEPRVLANPVQAKPAGTLGSGAADSGPIGLVAADAVPSADADQTAVPRALVTEPQTPAVTALAVVVSDRTPVVGQVLTVVNRSRDQGYPKTVAIGTPITPRDSFAPNATKRFTLFDPGTFTLDLSASGHPNVALAMSLPLPVTGDPRAPIVTIFPADDAVSGELVTLSARVTEAAGNPAGGRPVRFSIGSLAAVATSGDDGVATTTIRADLSAGAWPLRAEVLTDAGAVAAVAETTIILGANLVPVADAGGPYFVNISDALTLDGSGTFDPDGEPVGYNWDLDGDGVYDDAEGVDPTIDFVDLEALLCEGLCDTDVEHPIGLRVVDSKRGSSDDVATVTFTRDFAVVIAPETIIIAPGSSNTFLVDVATTSGFTGAVALSVAGLPTGATAVFDPATIAPGQQSALTITLPSDVGGLKRIDLSVTGTNGSLVRTANSTVDVVFGLPPRCSTSVEGTVLDAETGEPLVGASVRVTDANGGRTLQTDQNGRWRVDAAYPSTTNQPGPISLRVEAQDHWLKDLKSTAACGVPLVLEDRLLPVHYVHVRGQVRVGAESPNNPLQLVPTDAVAPNTRVTVAQGNVRYLENAVVNSDGEFEVDVPLGNGNTKTSAAVQGTANGYWTGNATVELEEGSEPFVMVLLRGKCTARITGGRVTDVGGKAVPGAGVSVGGKAAVAGPDGWYTVDADVPMATGNLGGSASVTASPPPGRTDLLPGTKSVTLHACDDVLRVDVVLPTKPNIPPPVTVYGNISGVITDVDTGLPVGGARVATSNRSTTTATDGSYLLTDVAIGTGSATQASIGVSITKAGYWQESGTVTVRKDETSPFNHTMLAIRTGTVSGVVRDQVTNAPLAGATVTAGSAVVHSDDLGRFTATGVALGNHNNPATASVSAELAGYWRRSLQVQVRDGETVSADLALLRECATAEIRGIVVNAQTRQPIAGARVQPKEMPAVTTGPDGRFTITDVKMKTGNTPWAVELTASATGFVTQKKTVNVFCGARIEVGFGSLPASPGVITGVVTDAASGSALGGVFVGTGFGGGVRTAADGSYRFDNVPTNDNGTPIEWEVSVVPDPGDPHLAATQIVSVLPGATVSADFALALPPPPNEAPVAVLAAPAAVAEGGDVALDASASSDPEGGALAFAWDLDADGAFDDATGATSTLRLAVAGSRVVSVQVTDAAGATAVAAVEVVASNVNPAVDAGGDVTLETDGHLARTGSFADPGADTFTASVDYGEGAGSQPLAIDGTAFVLDHTYPAGTYTVTVWVYDGHGGSGQDVFAANVPQLPPPNAVPVAGAVSVTTERDTAVAVSLTGTDADGDPLTYAIVDAPTHGVLTGTAPQLTYLAATVYTGTDTFTYTVSDGKSVSQPATVTITVQAPPPPPNAVPVAGAVSVTTSKNTGVAFTLTGTDADGDPLTYAIVNAPGHGALTGTAPSLTYTPSDGYTGTDSFTYTVSDGKAVSQPATVSVTVQAPPPPPPATVQLLLSDDNVRSRNVRPLDGQVLRNGAAMYVFVGPQAVVPSVKQVKFYLDDPQRKNAPFSVEAEVGWDFARTAANRNGCKVCADSPAYPFESNLLSLGTHTITALVEFKDGRTPVVLNSSLTIADTTPHQILVSTRSDRGNAVPLAGATLKDKRYVFLGQAQDAIAGAEQVRFVLDGARIVDEALAPYDLKATAADGKANAIDTRTLTVGNNTLEVIVTMPEGITYKYQATFKVIR